MGEKIYSGKNAYWRKLKYRRNQIHSKESRSIGGRKLNSKKNLKNLCPSISQLCVQINKLSEYFNVKTVCKALEVSRSTYYSNINAEPSDREKQNQAYSRQIAEIFYQNKGRYGSIRITKSLGKNGVTTSPKRVLKLMRRMGLRCIHRKKYKPQSSKGKVLDGKVNLLKQDFSVSRPNEKWLTDITYIHTTKNGWTYLALVIDLFSRLIVGYAYGLNIDSALVVEAVNTAIMRRGAPIELIIHSDLGSQYTSDDFEKLFDGVKIRHSYSKKGCPYDNSPMESFNATLKKEEVYTTMYADYDTARLKLFEYIEGYYNRNRIHSSLDYVTPHEFKATYYHTH